MNSFTASYKNELSKLKTRKKYIVFIIIGIIICLIWAFTGRLIANFAQRQAGMILRITPTPMNTLPFFLSFFIPFLMFMGITDLFTVETIDSTMKAMIYRPVERYKLYAAKILAVVTYAGLYLSCLFILGIALSFIFGNPLTGADIFYAFVSYILTLIPLAILAAYAALIAILGRSGTLTMFILLVSYIFLNALPVFFPVTSEVLFTSYLRWYRLWVGVTPAGSKMIQMLLILTAYGTAFFTAGSLIFDRKEY